MRRRTAHHRVFISNKSHPSVGFPSNRTTTVTEEAQLWKAYRLSNQSSTTRTFRPQRSRPSRSSLLGRLKNQVMVALGIW